MSITLYKANQRGIAEHGWLQSRFSFSFAEYYNPSRMGFGVLRVINDDIIKAGYGFGLHPHRDMEIITLVTKGTLIHEDSLGHKSELHAGEIQYMRAGTGIVHAEYASQNEDVSLFQIWIKPSQKGRPPHYEQRSFLNPCPLNEWQTLIASDGRENSIIIEQDACIKRLTLEPQHTITTQGPRPIHGHLLLVIEGEISLEGTILTNKDEVQIVDEGAYCITALCKSSVLLFDIPLKE